jgi:hypothetical protein
MTRKSKHSISLKSQTDLQLWKTWVVVVVIMMMMILLGLRKVLEYKHFSHRQP